MEYKKINFSEFEQISGCYDFGSYTQINPLNSKSDFMLRYTSEHEQIHFLLNSNSSHGMLLHVLKKIHGVMCTNNLFGRCSIGTEERARSLISYLNEISRKMHEGLAVFVEWYKFYSDNVEDGNRFLHNLKKKNKEYYSYIKPMLFIIDDIKKDNSSQENINIVVTLLFIVGINCLSIPIELLIEKNITSLRKYKKYISINGNKGKIIPDKTFEEKLQQIKLSMKKGRSLLESISLVIDNNIFFMSIEQGNEVLAKIKQYILLIFSNDGKYNTNSIKDKQTIKNILEDFKLKEITTSELNMLEIPMNIPLIYDMNKIDKDEINSLINEGYEGYTILVLSGTRFKEYNKITALLNKEIIKLEKEDSPIIFYDLNKKRQFVSKVDNEYICKIVKYNYNVNVVVSYKNYNYEKNIINNIDNYDRDLYIYCDRPYYSVREYLDKINNDNVVYYSALQYISMYVVIIKIFKHTYFIFPVTQHEFPSICYDFDHNRPLFKCCIKENVADDIVIKNKQHKREIDIIVNSLFFMGAIQNKIKMMS